MVTSMHAGNPVFMTVEPFTADPDSGTFHQGEKVACFRPGMDGAWLQFTGGRALPSPFLLPDSHLI